MEESQNSDRRPPLTHPVHVLVAFRYDMSVEECGFTRCGETRERTRVLSFGPSEAPVQNQVRKSLFLHAGKPTATMTSVLLEVSDADGGS